MVFIGEDGHFGGDAAEFGCIECHFALRGENAIIKFAVGDENRGSPFVDEAVRRHGVGALRNRVVFAPVSSVGWVHCGVCGRVDLSAAHVPVCEPHFFGFKVLGFHVDTLIKQGIADGCGVDAPGSFVSWLCKRSEVYAMEMPGKRYDIGNLESYAFVRENYYGIELR